MNPLLGVLKKQNRSFDDVYIKTSVLFKKAAYKAALIQLPKGVGEHCAGYSGQSSLQLAETNGAIDASIVTPTEPCRGFVDVMYWAEIDSLKLYAQKKPIIGLVTYPYQPLEEKDGRTHALLRTTWPENIPTFWRCIAIYRKGDRSNWAQMRSFWEEKGRLYVRSKKNRVKTAPQYEIRRGL